MAKSSKKISIMNDDRSIIGYDTVLSDVIDLLESARRASARTINSIMTATYWEIGRRIVENEQVGAKRAEYGKKLLKKLSVDLKNRFGRGFSERNLEQMRLFYIGWPISQTLSAKSNGAVESNLLKRFSLPWSHYVRLLSVNKPEARTFYEAEALRGGWSVRLELGGDFAFIGRQRHLRIGDQWFRVDLVFFHRVLHCLVIIDLKVGKFHACGRRADAPLSQLCPRKLDAYG